AAVQLSKRPLNAGEQTESVKKKATDGNGLSEETAPSVSGAVVSSKESTAQGKAPAAVPEPVLAGPSKPEPAQTEPAQAESAQTEPPPKPKLSFPKLGDFNLGAKIPSLHSVFDEKKVDEEKGPVYVTGDAQDNFGEQVFLSHWATLAETVKAEGKISLYTVMTANKPELKENYKVNIIVENAIQQQLLIESKVDVLNYMRQKLNNFQVDLIPVMQQNHIIRKPVTDSEKYQAMVAQ